MLQTVRGRSGLAALRPLLLQSKSFCLPKFPSISSLEPLAVTALVRHWPTMNEHTQSGQYANSLLEWLCRETSSQRTKTTSLHMLISSPEIFAAPSSSHLDLAIGLREKHLPSQHVAEAWDRRQSLEHAAARSKPDRKENIEQPQLQPKQHCITRTHTHTHEKGRFQPHNLQTFCKPLGHLGLNKLKAMSIRTALMRADVQEVHARSETCSALCSTSALSEKCIANTFCFFHNKKRSRAQPTKGQQCRRDNSHPVACHLGENPRPPQTLQVLRTSRTNSCRWTRLSALEL